MLAPLNSLLCRHEYYWSERHNAHRCRRCNRLREDQDDAASMAIPEPAERVPELTEAARLDPVDWRRPGRDEDAEQSSSVDGATLRQEATERRERLILLLASLQAGDPLDRNAILDLTMAIVEDAHSAEPLLFGKDAASHFAKLYAARMGLRGLN